MKSFKLHHFLLVFVCLVAFLLRVWGIEWPSLHPDEQKIASWIEYRADHRHLESFYAEGFFVLVKPAYAVHRWIAEKVFQWKCFLRTGEQRVPVEREAILFARWFNVWLAVATVAVLYLLVVTVTRSSGAGLFAASCLALSHFHVEHSHYGETDIAAMFMLAVSLWLWARVIQKESRFRFLLAAFVTGFAVGTKFTLSPLLALAIIMAWKGGIVEGQTRVRSGLRRSLLVLVLFFAGLVWANPGFLDWRWIGPQLQRALSSVYAERSGLMGGVADKWMPVLVNWKEFRLDGAELGWPWVVLGVLGFAASLCKVYRGFWPVTFIFPVVFFIYFVFVAPWVRTQEFMLFSCSFGIWSAVGLVSVAGILEKHAKPVFRYGICTLLVFWVLSDVAVGGLRRASFFAWPDPRVAAKEWLGVHVPDDRVIACSHYTDPVFRQKHGKFSEAGYVERKSVAEIRERGASYIIRNPAVHGRGTLNPLTGVRFAQYDQYWNEFINSAQRIWLWTSLEPPFCWFSCAPIECWGLVHASPAVSADVPFFQPGFMSDSRDESVWNIPGSVGSSKIIEVTKRPRNLVLGGPAEPGRPVYVLVQTAERGAVVRVKGMGQSHRIKMPPYSVEVLSLKRSWYQPRCSAYDVINICAEPEKYILGIPCFAEVITDETVVMSRLIQKGYPDKALSFLKAWNPSNLTDRMVWPAFVAATDGGDWSLAGKFNQRAENLLRKLREAATNSSEKIEFCGISGIYYDDYSRVRMEPVYADLIPDGPGSQGLINITQNSTLPVRLARGDYMLSFIAQMAASDSLRTGEVAVTINAPGAKSQTINLDSAHDRPVLFSLHVEREKDLQLSFTANCAGRIDLKNIELRWRLSDMIRSVDIELCRALSRYDLYSKSPSDALAGISERSRLYPDDLELLRLNLKAMQLNNGSGADEQATIISRLKNTAPEYSQNINVDGELAVKQVFYPFFRLSGVKHDALAKTLQCSFEVLRDEAPASIVVLSELRSWPRRWSKIRSYNLGSRAVLFQGEQFCVNISLPEGAKAPFNDLALSVRTSPRWVPYDYAATGRNDSKIPVRLWFQKP